MSFTHCAVPPPPTDHDCLIPMLAS